MAQWPSLWWHCGPILPSSGKQQHNNKNKQNHHWLKTKRKNWHRSWCYYWPCNDQNLGDHYILYQCLLTCAVTPLRIRSVLKAALTSRGRYLHLQIEPTRTCRKHLTFDWTTEPRITPSGPTTWDTSPMGRIFSCHQMSAYTRTFQEQIMTCSL